MKTTYFLYYNRPVKIVKDKSGHLNFWTLDGETGGWVAADWETQFEIEHPPNRIGCDLHQIDSEQEFVQAVERWRARFIKGEGAVFALYLLMNEIEQCARSEKRRLTQDEQRLLYNLRLQTHALFESALGTEPTQH